MKSRMSLRITIYARSRDNYIVYATGVITGELCYKHVDEIKHQKGDVDKC